MLNDVIDWYGNLNINSNSEKSGFFLVKRKVFVIE